MRKREVSVYVRLKEGNGKQPYVKACYSANGTLRPEYAIVGGKVTHRPDGVFYIRYRTKDGQRKYEYVGQDPKLAMTVKLKRQHIIAGEDMGLPTVETAPIPRPPKPDVSVLPSVSRLVNPQAPAPDAASPRLVLSKTIDGYVAEKKITTTADRAREYRFQLGEFLKQAKIAYLDEINDDVVVAYIAHLKKQGKSARTIENRIANLSAFLRRYGFEKRFNRKHVPKPTKTLPKAYSPETLKMLFAAATPEEFITFQFFLGMGMREREVMFAAWPDIDWRKGTFKVTEKPDVGFTIKDKEERVIPIPSHVLSLLRERLKSEKRHSRWVFPTEKGQPNGHLLRDLQKLALRAGLNCGMCVTKGGDSCADTACCREFGLHQFRRTFATLHHEAGVSVRQLMLWLGHASMETTLSYLSAAEAGSEKARVLVDRTWTGLAA